MVRLEAEVIVTASTIVTGFQFQNGTIRRPAAVRVTEIPALFQFQNGTIRRPTLLTAMMLGNKISIPKWYD